VYLLGFINIFDTCYKKEQALQMIDCFKSFQQVDLSGLKPETVLKPRVTRLTILIHLIFFLDNSIFEQYSVVKIIGLSLRKKINVNTVDRRPYFLKTSL